MSERIELACDFLIVGGGVAGVSCLEELKTLTTGSSVILLTACDYVKQVSCHKKITRAIEELKVEETNVSSFGELPVNIQVLVGKLESVDVNAHKVYTTDGRSIFYKKLNIATGALPKRISSSSLVLTIRDLESISYLQEKVTNARRVIVVGNGGIALEFVYGLKNCDIVWAIKDDAIGNVFLDKAAADFLLEGIDANKKEKKIETKELVIQNVSKRQRFDVEDYSTMLPTRDKASGASLGPDWKTKVRLQGAKKAECHSQCLQVEYNCEVAQIVEVDQHNSHEHLANYSKSDDLSWPLYVELTNGKVFGADMVLSATGVVPNVSFRIQPHSITLGKDGGIAVDTHMRTSATDVYASGDVCCASWEGSEQWFQMRLWTQARQMGIYCARCMVADISGQEAIHDICFELFAHVTSFFGYKVCLLGNYNGQGLNQNFEVFVRKTSGEEYVKLICKEGRVVGALLIGETDLEETFENLILNQTDVSRFGESLLDPSIDIEDYFD